MVSSPEEPSLAPTESSRRFESVNAQMGRSSTDNEDGTRTIDVPLKNRFDSFTRIVWSTRRVAGEQMALLSVTLS